MEPNRPILIDAREAGRLLDMLPARVTRFAKQGVIPSVVLPDKEVRFRPSDLEAWVDNQAKEGRQYQLRDLQNARVEAIDMLFFWVSLCQLLGLRPDDIYRLYRKKLHINLRRQAEGRAQADHPRYEEENRDVT